MRLDSLFETSQMAFDAFSTGSDQGLVSSLSPVFPNRMLSHLEAQKLKTRVLSVESVALGCFLRIKLKADFMEPFLQGSLGTMDGAL